MLLNKQLTTNYQLVELQIPANSPNQKFNFPDQPNLRDKAIEKIEIYNNSSLCLATAPSGFTTTVPNFNAYLTLVTDNGNEFVQNILVWELIGVNAYASFMTTNNGFNIALRKIVWPKSYITYNLGTVAGATYSWCFGIYYK